MGTVPERIVLIGLRRSGKTTVGRILAEATGWTVHDTDEIVRRTTGQSPAEWIRAEGIDAFRAAERAAVATLSDARDAVIATGGGAPLSDENRRILRPRALVAYLRVDPWVLAERARHDPLASQRPLLAGVTAFEEPFVLFAERDALYRNFSDLIVDGSLDPETVAARVLGASGVVRKSSPR